MKSHSPLLHQKILLHETSPFMRRDYSNISSNHSKYFQMQCMFTILLNVHHLDLNENKTNKSLLNTVLFETKLDIVEFLKLACKILTRRRRTDVTGTDGFLRPYHTHMCMMHASLSIQLKCSAVKLYLPQYDGRQRDIDI